MNVKNMFKSLSLGICLFILPTSSFSGASMERVNDKYTIKNEEYSLSYIFPVNVVNSNVNVTVSIPKNFKAIPQPPNSGLLEFMPANESDPYQWTEIVTLIPMVGKGIVAKEFLSVLINNIQKNDPDMKILEKNNQINENYQVATAIVQYRTNLFNKRGRNEIVMLYAASGPYDAICVQYALLLGDRPKSEAALLKLKQFMNNQITLLK